MSQDANTVKIEKFTASFDDPKRPGEKFHIDIAWFPTARHTHSEGIEQIKKAMKYLGEHKLVQFKRETQEITIGPPDERLTLSNNTSGKLGENLNKIAYCYVTLKNKK